MDGGSAHHDGTGQTQTTIVKRTLKAVKAAQDRLHRERMLAIEGDEPETDRRHTGAETGFGDDGADQGFSALPTITAVAVPLPAQTWIDIAPGATFTRAAAAVSAARTLNRMQHMALTLVCEALDARVDGEERQHLQYIGGGGGTGKSWLIDSVKQVFAAKDVSNQLVITAMSRTAAAGIEGTTLHSAVGLTFRNAEGAMVNLIAAGNIEKAKERWRRRSAFVVDKVSMLGLLTLYEVNQKLPMLRGFLEEAFRGLPVVIFTSNFLQFTPVLQKSLLADIERIATGPDGTRPPPSGSAAERRWREAEAKKLW
ncbi:ATP-dependent DNA helicase pfh1 [Colletotrichum spaethianum]|uniref:ATP-dependent DNA helicase n=1 Tax=Colletotrichum spaethianum TaxID=700344 RepID=A0AA37PGD7_9PEZI|nr:ATP-dependent DNA helicase pfh1 [Colletotrichum spaethianum]GKT51821.1 ATP-dependent DNA helicase pfh1 [Colletotrichum spaethianum]